MKRVISILIILSLALCTFPVFIPVSAAETSGNYFNVLDYTGIDDGLSNTFDVEGSTTVSYNLSTYLGSFPVYGVELTYSYVGVQPSISSFKLNDTGFVVSSSQVSSGLVRVRGDLAGSFGSSFTITFDASVTTVTIHSFNVYSVGVSDAPISGIMLAGNTQVSFDGLTASTINPSYGTFLQIRTDWWRNYDYADVWLTLSALGINSISAVLQETSTGIKYNIPYEVNYLNTFFDSTTLRDYEVQLHLDFSGLDHANIGDAILRIEFQLDWTSSSNLSCTMNSFRGFVFTDPIDSHLKWHQILFTNLSNWFLSVVSVIGDLDQNITNLFDSWFAQLAGWLSGFSQEVSRGFDSVLDKIDSIYDSSVLDDSKDDLNTGIDDFQSSLQTEDELFNNLTGIITDTNGSISESFPGYYEYISATSVWGSILAFSWKPFDEVSSLMLLFLGCCILINVVLIKR